MWVIQANVNLWFNKRHDYLLLTFHDPARPPQISSKMWNLTVNLIIQLASFLSFDIFVKENYQNYISYWRCIRLYSINQVGDIMEFTFNSNIPSLDNFLLDQLPCNEIRSMISLCFHHRSLDDPVCDITVLWAMLRCMQQPSFLTTLFSGCKHSSYFNSSFKARTVCSKPEILTTAF
jgi:hypothetical protein